MQSVARDLKLNWMERGLDHLAAPDGALMASAKYETGPYPSRDGPRSEFML